MAVRVDVLHRLGATAYTLNVTQTVATVPAGERWLIKRWTLYNTSSTTAVEARFYIAGFVLYVGTVPAVGNLTVPQELVALAGDVLALRTLSGPATPTLQSWVQGARLAIPA